MQLMLKSLSPTPEPLVRGSHVYTGARPLPRPSLPLCLGPATSAEPKYAAEMVLLPASPVKVSRIGMPLATDEMPETCQPLSSPRPSGLFIAPLAPSGSSAFHEALRVCVRSESRMPYVRPGS